MDTISFFMFSLMFLRELLERQLVPTGIRTSQVVTVGYRTIGLVGGANWKV
jgi:hypothetical protein